VRSDSEPSRVLFEGEFIRAVRRGHWEYVERVRQIAAVMIVAVVVIVGLAWALGGD